MSKKFKELDLSNAFLFSAALEDEEICRMILEIILERKIPKVRVHAEHNILFSTDYRSVRLDIFASDEVEVSYDLEMQNADCHNLAKRSRLYQAQMDMAAIKPGGNFEDLKPSYIIFICTFDPFHQGLYRYTFEAKCREREISLADDACRIFLNTKGTNDTEVPEQLIHFLRYVEESTDDYVDKTGDASIHRLHAKVSELKEWREMEERYMTFEEMLEMREKAGKEIGKAEGRTEGKAEAVLELLEECGSVPGELRKRIMEEQDSVVLSGWLKLAAGASEIGEFRNITKI